MPVAVHHVAIQRAGASVARIDATLAEAQRRGDLASFNQAYKARRAAAQARGCGFMPYAQALRRLRQAVAGVAANGGQCSRSLMLSVFGDVKP